MFSVYWHASTNVPKKSIIKKESSISTQTSVCPRISSQQKCFYVYWHSSQDVSLTTPYIRGQLPAYSSSPPHALTCTSEPRDPRTGEAKAHLQSNRNTLCRREKHMHTFKVIEALCAEEAVQQGEVCPHVFRHLPAHECACDNNVQDVFQEVQVGSMEHHVDGRRDACLHASQDLGVVHEYGDNGAEGPQKAHRNLLWDTEIVV